MLIGVPKEIKDNEYRAGLVPSAVRELVANRHHVLVETGAGLGAGLSDSDYEAAGGEIVPGADDVFARAELIVKVKEPLPPERKKLRRGQILFTYLHLAPDPAQTEDLIASGVTAIAYETVTSPQGTLPLLTPMSEVAGRMAPHVGANYLEKARGGRGILMGGVPGVPPADVLILGAGVSGTNAALIALGMGAGVTVLDRNPEALRRFKQDGRGVLIFLRDGAAGVPTQAIPAAEGTRSEVARSRQWREVGLGAQILTDLGISSIRLLSSAKLTYVGLGGFGIEILATETLDG